MKLKGGSITFKCGHTLHVGYGPYRSCAESCRDCLKRAGKLKDLDEKDFGLELQPMRGRPKK